MDFLNTPNPESEDANTHKQLLQRTELIGGTTITTSISPRNETVAQRLFDMLASQIGEREYKVFLRGRVFLDEQNCFVPDVAVVCDPSKVQADGIHGAPDFVIEIVVPATELILRSNKRQTYEKCGVRELWIADAQANIVEMYLFDKEKPPTTL